MCYFYIKSRFESIKIPQYNKCQFDNKMVEVMGICNKIKCLDVQRVRFVEIIMWITYFLTQWLKVICGDGKKYEI